MEHYLFSQPERNLKVNEIIKKVASTIEASQSSASDLGLLNGLSGKLLFLWQLGLHDDSMVDEKVFAQNLQFLEENLNQIINHAQLSYGLTGIGWFFEYTNQTQSGEYDAELCLDIDAILQQGLSAPHWRGEIEMVLGLGGYAIYAARRKDLSAQTKFFDRILMFFEQLATFTTNNMVTWNQPPKSVYRLDKESKSAEEYNLGLAHGVPGIIASLLPALNCPQLRKRAENLISNSCNWLLSQQQDPKEYGSYFSTVASSNKVSRLAWCYGDLTIALTLYRAGAALNNPSYIDKAIEIGLHSASRNLRSSIVQDAGICHGSAGLYLIFNKLFKASGVAEFEVASLKWLDHTLALFERNGLSGFDKFDSDGFFVQNLGFLEGYAGIGLCLLSSITGEDNWADCLLLS